MTTSTWIVPKRVEMAGPSTVAFEPLEPPVVAVGAGVAVPGVDVAPPVLAVGVGVALPLPAVGFDLVLG
jgi:hypothetical protein